MTRRQLRSSVRWESVIIALLGTLLGLVIGVVVRLGDGAGARRPGHRQVLARPGAAPVIVILAAVFGVIAAAWPARRAAKLDVLDVDPELKRARTPPRSLPNLCVALAAGWTGRGVGSSTSTRRDPHRTGVCDPRRATRPGRADAPRRTEGVPTQRFPARTAPSGRETCFPVDFAAPSRLRQRLRSSRRFGAA